MTTSLTASASAPWLHSDDALREALALLLEETRAQTLSFVASLPKAAPPLSRVLLHLARFEERWVVRALGGEPALPSGDPPDVRAALARVRTASLTQLVRTSFPPDDPLRHAAFVFGLVLQHELRHLETLIELFAPRAAPTLPAPRRDEVLVPGGPFVLGTDDEPWALDHERPGHVVDVPPFLIDAAPVTNGEYLAFMEDGGYERRELWSEEGFAFVTGHDVTAPLHWRLGRDGHWRQVIGGRRTLLLLEAPVQNVSWYEADAYARWAKKRLPTEAEWEKAASWDASGKRRFPWGDGAPSANHRRGAGSTASGITGMVGLLWAWTSSDFAPYPGFTPCPAPEVSRPWFGRGFKVLRGGSFAAHPLTLRNTARRWEPPSTRWAFAGIRCVRDA